MKRIDRDIPRVSLLTCVFAFGSYPMAYAEDSTNDDASVLDPVVVYGEGYRTTGTKTDLEPIEAPMSFEVYDAELLEQRQVDSVNEALRYVPGVTPESRATVTIFDQYTMRGFQSYRNYYDGLPLQYNNVWNLAPQVDAFATESVEVLKGPTSVLYGSAPPGGMVTQTAKQPQSKQQTHLRARVGTNALMELAVDNTGAATDDIDYRFIALARQKDGQMETTEEQRLLVAPSATWYIGDKTSLNLNLYYQNDPKMVPSTPLPATGTLYEASYGKLEADAYAGDENWGNFDREVTMAGYKLNHEFTDSLTFLQNFRYTYGDGYQKNTYNYGLAGGGDDRTLIRTAYFTDEVISGFAVDNQFAWSLGTGTTEHDLLFGLDYQSLDSDVEYGDTLSSNTPTIDLANPDHDQIDPDALPLDTYTQNHAIEQKQLGVYIQDEMHWGALTVLANLRQDFYESVDDAEINGSPSTTEIDQDALSGRLATIYNFESGLAPYLSYAESFEPTSGVDSETGEAFKPTTARQYEAGVKFQGQGGLEFTAAVFDITQENVVVNTPDFMQYTQTGEINSRGFELALNSWITDFLKVQATYNQQDVTVTENPLDPSLEGNTPVWVADRQASLWATYYVTDALDVSAGVRHVGESMLDAANSDTVPGYTLVDMAASYVIAQKYRLGLTVSNLADERYVGACFDANNCWMGAERSAELTFSVDL